MTGHRGSGDRLPFFSTFTALVSVFCRVPCFQGGGKISGDAVRAAHLEVKGSEPGQGEDSTVRPRLQAPQPGSVGTVPGVDPSTPVPNLQASCS